MTRAGSPQSLQAEELRADAQTGGKSRRSDRKQPKSAYASASATCLRSIGTISLSNQGFCFSQFWLRGDG